MSDANDNLASSASSVYSIPLTLGAPDSGSRCAGTHPPAGDTCRAPATRKVEGLSLCERHAREFEAQARVDILEVAEGYLSRWSEAARKLCNEELSRRLQPAHKEVEAELERACEALERSRCRGGSADDIPESFELTVADSGRPPLRPKDVGAALGTILDSLDEGVLATDLEGNVLFANPAAREMLGIRAGEWSGRVPDPWEEFDLPEAIARCTGRRERIEARAYGGGTFYRVKLEYLLEFDERGGGALIVVQDLSETEQLEERQQQFLANAAHELKTPLTAIVGAAEILLEREHDPETQRRFLEHIHLQAERMQRLSESLLRLARAGVDLREPDLRPVAMNFLKEVAGRVEPLVEGAGLHLVLDDRGGRVLADPELLEQALLVLVSNAIKHSEKEDRVWLRVESASITVEDEGEGIRAEDIPYVFEHNYQGEAAKGGSGLGLTICKDLIERMGGEISIESEKGVGTTVTIELPEIAPHD